MKKILLSVLTLALSVNLFAIDYTGRVTVAIFDGSHLHNVTVAESSDVPSGQLLNGYYTPIQDMASLNVAAYVSYNSVAYENIVLNSLKNTPLLVKANAATAYQLYFANLEGTITLYDTKTAQFVDMTSNPYDFTIEASERDANNIVANRFVINYVPAPTPSAPQVTTNDKGWATFSYDQDLVPVDATAQTLYKGAINGEVLSLDPVDYVKAGEGVIVYGAPSTTYDFAVGNGSDDFSGNDLKATSTYSTSMQNVFVLKGDAFLEYVGTNALALNKAYIQLPQSGAGAPQRIRMVINETTAVENVEVEAVKAVKFIENGQILIKRGEAVYNMQGQIVK